MVVYIVNLEIEELLLNQEHIIWQQAREIEELRRRLKQLESLDFQNEQLLHLQNINIQLKTQIEFLKSEIQEKDAMIASFTSKPVQVASPEILAAQQQLIQQNLQLQNIIGDLQNQILNKDSLITQLKTQENTLDQLIGHLQSNIDSKKGKVGIAKQSSDTQGIINELQQYPEALQDIIERICQEYKKMQLLLEEKDIEIKNLQARVQLQSQNVEDTIQELKKRELSPSRQDQGQNLAKQTAAMDDAINDLERKLLSQENRRKDLQAKLLETGTQNVQLEKQLQETVQIEAGKEQNFTDQKQIEERIDNLVYDNQNLENLIAELQQKLIFKEDQKQEIEQQIQQLNVPLVEQQLQDAFKQKQNLLGEQQKLSNELIQLKQVIDKQQEELNQLEAEKKTNQDSINQNIQMIKQQHDKLDQIVDLKNTTADQLAQHEEMKQLQEKFRQTEDNNKLLESLVQDLQEEMKKQQQQQPEENELKQQQLEQTQSQNQQLKHTIRQLEEQNQQIQNANASLQQRLDDLQSKAIRHSQKIRDSSKQNSELESSNSEILDQRQQVKVKEQKLDDLVRENLTLEDLINELELKLVEKNDKKEEILQQLNQETQNDFEQQIKNLTKQLEQVTQNNNEIKEKLIQYENPPNQILKQAVIQENDKKQVVTENTNDLIEQNSKIDSQIETLQKQLAEKEQQLADKEQQLNKIVLQIKNKDDQIQQSGLQDTQQIKQSAPKPQKQKKVVDEKFREPFQNIVDQEEFSFDVGTLNPSEEPEVTYSPEQTRIKAQRTKPDVSDTISVPLEILKNYEYLIREKDNEIEELRNELNNQALMSVPVQFAVGNIEGNQQMDFQLCTGNPETQMEQNFSDNQQVNKAEENKVIEQQQQQIKNLKEQIQNLKQLPTLAVEQLENRYAESLARSDDLVQQNIDIADSIIELEEKLANKLIEKESLQNQLQKINAEFDNDQQKLKMIEFFNIKVLQSPAENEQIDENLKEGLQQQLKDQYEKEIKDLKNVIENLNQKLQSNVPETQVQNKIEQKAAIDQFDFQQTNISQKLQDELTKQNQLIQEVATLEDIIQSLQQKIIDKQEQQSQLEQQLNQLDYKLKPNEQLQESATMASTSKIDQANLQQQYDNELKLLRLQDKYQQENENLKQQLNDLNHELLSLKQDLPTRDEFQNQQFLLQQIELENKTLSAEIKQLEDQLHNQNRLNKDLQNRIDNQQEQAIQHSQKISESFKDINSSNSEIKETRQKISEKQQKADELVKEHLSLDDLITALEQKLVEKNDYKNDLHRQLASKEIEVVQQQEQKVQQQPFYQKQEPFQEISEVPHKEDEQISVPLQAGQLIAELEGGDKFKETLNPTRSQPVFLQTENQEQKLQTAKSTQGFVQPEEFLQKTGLDNEKVAEMWNLIKNNHDVEKRIQELKSMLARKNKRKDQLEGVIFKDVQAQIPQMVANEKKELQDQLHQKNVQIAQLNEELTKLQEKVFEKDKEIDEKDREFRNSQLVKSFQEACDKQDELVRKNNEIEELILKLEVRLAERQVRAKELELQLEGESSISNIQEPRESGMQIQSYDQAQDQQLQEQEKVLSGYTLNIDQLKNKIELLTGQLEEKEIQNEQLRNQVNDLKKQIHGYQLAQQDVKVIKKQNKQLQDQIQALVEENLNFEDLIRDSEFKLQEKKNKMRELNMEIKNAEIQIQIEKQKKEDEILQQKILQTDELIKKNLEMDEALTNLELRLMDKEQQKQALESRFSNQSSRILQQPLYIYQEDSDEKASNIKTEASPKASQNYLIQEHNNNLSQLQGSISQMQESVRQLQLMDESELDFLMQQQKERQIEVEQLKQQLQQQEDHVKELRDEQKDKQDQILQLKKENANFDELVVELQEKQKKMIEQEVSKESGHIQEIGGTEQQEIQRSISENLELAKKLHDLKQAQIKLKNQIKNLESLIVDQELQVTEKKNEIQRISRDNQLYQTQNRKQKTKRDQLHKEQNSLQYQLRMLEPQLTEMQQTEKQVNDAIEQLKQQLVTLNKLHTDLENEVQQKLQSNSELAQQLQKLNEEIQKEREKQAGFEQTLQQCRQNNQGLEQEVFIYRDLNLEDISLNEKIDLITKQIDDDKQIYKALLEEHKETQEQIDLLIPQNKEIQQMQESVKLQYENSVDALTKLQEELQQMVEQKNKVFQEIHDATKYIDDNNAQLQDYINQKQQLEEKSRIEETLLKAIKAKTIKQEEDIEQEKLKLNTTKNQLDSIRQQLENLNQELKDLQQIIDEKNKEKQHLDSLKLNYQQQHEQVEKFQQDIDLNLQIIPEKEEQINKLLQIVDTKNKVLEETQAKIQNLEDQLTQQEEKDKIIQQSLNTLSNQISDMENQIKLKNVKKVQLEEQLNSIVLKDLEQALQEKLEQQMAQQELLDSIKQSTIEFENQKAQEGNILSMIENQKLMNNENRDLLENLVEQKKSIDSELHSNTAQLQEMNFQLKEQQEQLDKLNEQFKKVDEDSKMMEAVLQLKEKELRQLQKKKENLVEEMDKINYDVVEAQKQLASRRKKQRSLGAETLQQQEEEMEEDDIQGKINILNSKNSNLKDDLQKLVQESPEIAEQRLDLSVQPSTQFREEELLSTRKHYQEQIEKLEQIIKQQKDQIHDRTSVQNQITQQPTFYFDDDPILLELQEKFMKESDLLKDLQDRIKQTAESHYKLSLQLKEWAEKENRLAKELDTRRMCVEQIEDELQQVFTQHSDLESKKVEQKLSNIQLQMEIQELIEQEANTKNRLKEKKDYLQSLYKNLTESDQKLLQLRNRMALYSQEGRQLAEQVENLENEKENKLILLQDIQEELDHAEMEKQEKQALIQSITKEIQDTQSEKEELETQFAIVHSKNLQLRSLIGFEESLYQRLLQELEIQKKRDQIKYQNLFSDGSTQTEYDMDQFEALLNGTQMVKVTKEDVIQLKESCQRKLVQIYSTEKENFDKIINSNKEIKKMIHLQQMMITIQENEFELMNEYNSRRSSKLGFKALDESTYNTQFTLEQIDSMMNKTLPVEVQLNDHSIQIGDNKLARQWIIEKQFDNDNGLYPLGVLNLTYKVSLFQVIQISLTGTKVQRLYQQIL